MSVKDGWRARRNSRSEYKQSWGLGEGNKCESSRLTYLKEMRERNKTDGPRWWTCSQAGGSDMPRD